MVYRTLAGERVSQLGFGAMRLPTVGGKIDLPETNRMMRSAIGPAGRLCRWFYAVTLPEEGEWTGTAAGSAIPSEKHERSWCEEGLVASIDRR